MGQDFLALVLGEARDECWLTAPRDQSYENEKEVCGGEGENIYHIIWMKKKRVVEKALIINY